VIQILQMGKKLRKSSQY